MHKSIILLMLVALLSACGQKGPLYYPSEPAAGLPTATPTPPAGAQADDNKNAASANTKGP